MSKFRILPVMLVTLLLSSCTLVALQGSGSVIMETREVSNFEQVDVCCGMQLVLTQGEQEQLVLEGDDNILPEIETIVRGGTLNVHFRRNLGGLRLRLSRPVIVHLQMATIYGITISGGGSLETDRIETDRIETDRVTMEFSGGSQGMIGALQAGIATLNASGGGQIDIDNLTVDTLNLEVSGGGRTTIVEGVATGQRVVISGGSRYLASGVESQTATLEVSGGGEAEVWVTEALRVQASGGSDVVYSGNPSIEQELSGGSDLRSVDR
jgi:hypothetical protein